MSPEMTNFDLIPSPAGDGTLRGYLRGRFFDRLTQDILGMSCVFVVMDSRKKETALRLECCFFFLEQVTRLELATSTLARWRSTR